MSFGALAVAEVVEPSRGDDMPWLKFAIARYRKKEVQLRARDGMWEDGEGEQGCGCGTLELCQSDQRARTKP